MELNWTPNSEDNPSGWVGRDGWEIRRGRLRSMYWNDDWYDVFQHNQFRGKFRSLSVAKAFAEEKDREDYPDPYNLTFVVDLKHRPVGQRVKISFLFENEEG